MALDFKKMDKEYYQPKTTPSVVDIKKMQFLMQDGSGDPNTSETYTAAVQALYGLAYTIRMKKDWLGYQEFVVPPLEGLWEIDESTFKGGGAPVPDKGLFLWTMMIRQPDFVTEGVFEEAKEILRKKKPELDTSKIRLESLQEGLSVQVMHIGPYDLEGESVMKLDRYTQDNGYVPDFGGMRRHHEIYLSDPRKTSPEKLKTVLRHPIRKK